MAYSDMLNFLSSEATKKSREDGTDFQKMPLRPSSSGNCERELAYALNEYRGRAKYEKELLSPETMRIFGLGHSVEYALLKDMKQYFKDIFQVRYQQQMLSFMYLESKIDPKWSSWVEGSIDFVLWSDKFKAIGDVKSKKEKFSSYRDSDWTDTNEKYSRMSTLTRIGDTGFYAEDIEAFLQEVNDPFLAANIMQINLYANAEFITERGIDHCILIYYSKNTSRLRELRFKPSRALSDYVKAKFASAFDAVEGGDPTLAKKEFRLGSMKCAFCNYKKECWSDADALKMWFKQLPPKQWPERTEQLGELGTALENVYLKYQDTKTMVSATEALDLEICNLLVDAGIRKVKFGDGEVYEVKLLKSPKEHYELRRSK